MELKKDSHGVIYKIIDGTAYHAITPEAVVKILEEIRLSGRTRRIRIFYGDAKTGRDWAEEFDTIGYLGRSTGEIKIPLLINNVRSSGGPGLLDHCIVKIQEGKRVLYQHEKYNSGEWEIKELLDVGLMVCVYHDQKNVANFKSHKQAERYVAFMKGERNSK